MALWVKLTPDRDEESQLPFLVNLDRVDRIEKMGDSAALVYEQSGSEHSICVDESFEWLHSVTQARSEPQPPSPAPRDW